MDFCFDTLESSRTSVNFDCKCMMNGWSSGCCVVDNRRRRRTSSKDSANEGGSSPGSSSLFSTSSSIIPLIANSLSAESSHSLNDGILSSNICNKHKRIVTICSRKLCFGSHDVIISRHGFSTDG